MTFYFFSLLVSTGKAELIHAVVAATQKIVHAKAYFCDSMAEIGFKRNRRHSPRQRLAPPYIMLTAGVALRGVEALIDLVACYVLLYVLAAYAGSTIPGGGFYLGDAHLVMGVGILLAYYIVPEAIWGTTLGKLVTNIRVVKESDGGLIDWSAAIVRNVLRPIDGLVLYLVGFIVICVNQKRQRITDKVAGTIVVRRSAHAESVSHELR
jgi:uncharacterized RDD family membrane protein YckC